MSNLPSKLHVAETILEQLGGSRFMAMTGADMFAGSERTLAFSLPARFTANKANKCRITLTGADLYDVEFFTIKGANVTPRGEVAGVYADQLRTVFEKHTGLRTSL